MFPWPVEFNIQSCGFTAQLTVFPSCPAIAYELCQDFTPIRDICHRVTILSQGDHLNENTGLNITPFFPEYGKFMKNTHKIKKNCTFFKKFPGCEKKSGLPG